MTEEELTVAILAGWPHCFWCGKYFKKGTYENSLFCGFKCDIEQSKMWSDDFEAWKRRTQSHGFPTIFR